MGNKRSKRYSESEGNIDSGVLYSPVEAINLVKNSSTASFDAVSYTHLTLPTILLV